MPKLTSKRQVTIPQDICVKLGLEPGDTLKVFERDGVAHLVKMTDESLAGTLVCAPEAAEDLEETIKASVKSRAARKFGDHS